MSYDSFSGLLFISDITLFPIVYNMWGLTCFWAQIGNVEAMKDKQTPKFQIVEKFYQFVQLGVAASGFTLVSTPCHLKMPTF